MMVKLIDEFGERNDVQRAIESNIVTYSWAGSMTRYYAMFVEPLEGLAGHHKPEVARWSRRLVRQLRAEIERAGDRDAEYSALSEL